MTTDPQATLTWGVKQSFRNYVEMTGGVTVASDGVDRAPDGGFIFAAAPGAGLSLDADGKPQGRGAFVGEVSFEAHGGMLSVRLADPILEIGDAGAILTVADTAQGGRRLELARLDLAALTTSDAGEIVIPAALAIDGIQFLGDHYPAMTPLDAVRLTLAVP